MKLKPDEKKMLAGEEGEQKAIALDYLIQLGEAFDAKSLVDISYCHYPAEMAIYEGAVEEVVGYSKKSPHVAVPTTSSTLCCDLAKPTQTGCPLALAEKQEKVRHAHERMGILGTYTCTPQLNGFVPPQGSMICSVESSAIIYFNSVLGARTNRGGLFTRYSAITGKYPYMGYLMPENRIGTHLIRIQEKPDFINDYLQWNIFGYLIGSRVGSSVPVILGQFVPRQDYLIGFGAAMATSGSVTLYHLEGITPEALSMGDCFGGNKPLEEVTFSRHDFKQVIEEYSTIKKKDGVDFVTLGCPHYNLEQIRIVAQKLENKKVSAHIRFWICTSRMIRKMAEHLGYVRTIEEAGAKVIADTCPVESHMRISTCREYGLPVPNVKGMVSDSIKMVRYVSDLIGCQTALFSTDQAIRIAIEGRLP